MTRTDATSERGAFNPPPKFFKVKGLQGDVPIEQVRSKLLQALVALNRADTQNRLRHFSLTDDEVSALAFFGLDCGRGSRQSRATSMDVPTAQPASAHDSANLVATEPEDTATSSSLQLEQQSEEVPSTSLQGGCAGNLADADLMSPRALPAESPQKHSQPTKAGAAPPARKVNRSHFAQPDFEVVRQGFDGNGLSLKTLWHQYCQGHPNKRTYAYSQFCNRFSIWAASHSSTALSQGP